MLMVLFRRRRRNSTGGRGVATWDRAPIQNPTAQECRIFFTFHDIKKKKRLR